MKNLILASALLAFTSNSMAYTKEDTSKLCPLVAKMVSDISVGRDRGMPFHEAVSYAKVFDGDAFQQPFINAVKYVYEHRAVSGTRLSIRWYNACVDKLAE